MHVSSSPEPITCPFCSLKQFERADGRCSRCRHSLGFTYLEVFLHQEDAPSESVRSLSRLIRVLRARRGVTQTTLASLTGIHRTYLSRAERGQVTPSLAALTRIISALGVDKLMLRVRNSRV